MGKNFRGEPGKVEKAVLKSLELKILVLNRHVPKNIGSRRFHEIEVLSVKRTMRFGKPTFSYRI